MKSLAMRWERRIPSNLHPIRSIAAREAATKRILRESPDWPDSEFFQRQAEIAAPVMDSQDAREGARAFAEKRPPVWRGQ